MEDLDDLLKRKLSLQATARKALKTRSPLLISISLTILLAGLILYFLKEPLFAFLAIILGLQTYFFLQYRLLKKWDLWVSTLGEEEQNKIHTHFKKLSRSLSEEKKATKLVAEYQSDRLTYCQKHYNFYSPELEELLHQKIVAAQEVFFVRSLRKKGKERQEVNALMKRP